MSVSEPPPRSEIPVEFTWNDTSVFESVEDWEKAYQSLSEALEALPEDLRGFDQSAAGLAKAFQRLDELQAQIEHVVVYAGIAYSVDTTDQEAAGRSSQAEGLYARFLAATAFLKPGLLRLGREKLERWMKDEPSLKPYAHFVDDLFRGADHMRSQDVEEVLGLVLDPFGAVSRTAAMLTNADFIFEPAVTAQGANVKVTQSTYSKMMSEADRHLRRTAWEHYHDQYLSHKNTLANNLEVSIKQSVFHMRARRYDSTLEAALFRHNLPVKVFHNLLQAFIEHLPIWHRYFRLRRSILDVESLQPYDMWAPLTRERPTVTYQQAVDWVCEGLAPLGEAYVATVRRGCTEERWIDVYPNQGKRKGAFSSGAHGTHPFIVMSFNDTVFSLSTLAHELGHSMHSYRTWQSQPVVYSDYALFIAEAASNFHQAMVRAHLLEKADDPNFEIAIIEEAMANFYRYLFIMPTLARFEWEAHQRVERGAGLPADALIELMADLFEEGYGGEVELDRPRVGITWATFGHLYVDYYVFQYATGIAAAHALARRVREGAPEAVEDYLHFLSLGSSVYPLEALRIAGVDLLDGDAVEEVFRTMESLLDRLESLTT